jgi:carbon storage regulator
MLVLSRTTDESIIIDNNIHITILAVHGNAVRLGIVAPACVRVDREEVHERRLERPKEKSHP